MRLSRSFFVVLCFALAFAGALVTRAALAPAGTHPRSDAAVRAAAVRAYGRLPLAFEANRGQAGRGVAFLARGSGYGLALTRSGPILALRKPVHGSLASRHVGARAAGAGATLALRLIDALV